MPEDMEGPKPEEPFLEIETPKESSRFFTTGYILVIVASILISGFLIYFRFHTDSVAADKQSALDGLISTLKSKNNSETEKSVNNINSAVRILSTEERSKYLFKLFIDELKTKVTNDVKLNNLSIDSEGVVAIDGESASYRSVADLALSLKTSSKLSDVEIKSLSRAIGEADGKVNFSITANLTDWGGNSSGVEAEAVTPETTGGAGG